MRVRRCAARRRAGSTCLPGAGVVARAARRPCPRSCVRAAGSKARLARPRAVHRHEAGAVGFARRQPERQADPGRDAMRDQLVVVDPRRTRRRRRRRDQRVDEIAHRHCHAALQALNVPAMSRAARSSIHAARSRASMNCTGRSRGAGTTARSARSPSRADARSAQPSSRSGRCRRTDRRSSPGRTWVARIPKIRSTTDSHAALRAP